MTPPPINYTASTLGRTELSSQLEQLKLLNVPVRSFPTVNYNPLTPIEQTKLFIPTAKPSVPKDENFSQLITKLIKPQEPCKKCNCKNSQCLKLYCECFRARRFCTGCNCHNCKNTPVHMEERQKAISEILLRNPKAFEKKETSLDQIKKGQRGCNCKRSGC